MAVTTERQIPVEYDNRGNPVGKARMSAPDDSIGVMLMVPDRVIPVIFVPGVMGSNLRGIGPAAGTNWTLNSKASMSPWLTRGAILRKAALIPANMEVSDQGVLPEGTQLPEQELRRRGWGEVGALSYSSFLVWLENALSDFNNPEDGERMDLNNARIPLLSGAVNLTRDEIGLTYRYRFPVHACGYNWLDSNAVAAQRLGQRIDAVIARYRREGKKCEKVIVVTHSMGGLVARHCSEVGGFRDKIFGVVHGVMPAIGAAAVYRRFKAGTEGPYIASEVLGNDAAEMTAVLSSAPGPLQLLPTPEYGNGWLKIKDGAKEYSFPQRGDPYSEIYTVRGKWWSMCEDHLINPLNVGGSLQKRHLQMNVDWITYAKLILEKVKLFHDDIKDQYHPISHAFIGNHKDFKAYGSVTWTGNGGGWMRGDREADVLNATVTPRPNQIKTERNVAAPLLGSGWQTGENQTYTISEPDEDGDGTVPWRSGKVVRPACQSYMQVRVSHEPAYKFEEGPDNEMACRFTLRAIVKIAQEVQSTSLRYE